MPLDLNLLRSRPLALLVFAAAAEGQPWPADVTGCREGFYLASPAAAEGCTACPEVPQAIAVTCTGPDDSIATACQDTYHLKDDGSCAFDEAQEIAARILLARGLRRRSRRRNVLLLVRRLAARVPPDPDRAGERAGEDDAW